MSTNLRLSEELDARVKRESARTGMSQQQVIRAAIQRYLHDDSPLPRGENSAVAAPDAVASDADRARHDASSRLRPPRIPFRLTDEWITLPEGVNSLDLLDREDRF